eukprot:16451212-Heterocapsa_arctica.AAC.1
MMCCSCVTKFKDRGEHPIGRVHMPYVLQSAIRTEYMTMYLCCRRIADVSLVICVRRIWKAPSPYRTESSGTARPNCQIKHE